MSRSHLLSSPFRISPAQLTDQVRLDFLNTNIVEWDQKLQGLPKGAISEIWGNSSSGRSSFLVSFLAAATLQSEFCAWIDGSDAFDPLSAETAGADLRRLLWVRCGGKVEHAIRSADLLLHSGGWGVVVLDLVGISPKFIARIPVSYWYRFRRAVENKPTALVVISGQPCVRSCATRAIEMAAVRPVWGGSHRSFRRLAGASFRAQMRKPANSEAAVWEARALA